MSTRNPGTVWSRKSTNGRIIVTLLTAILAALATAPRAMADPGPGDAGSCRVATTLSVPTDLSAWAWAVVPRHGSDARRLRHLRAALLERQAPEAPEFVFTLVALARQQGIPAYFVAVDAGRGEVVRGRHLAAGVGDHGQIVVFDRESVTRPYHGRLRLLEDRTATAVQFGEAGVDRLAGGDLDGAWEQLEAAVGLDPDLAWAWTGLGDVLRQRGDRERAMDAYDRSLDLAAVRTW